jgi:hypothetical protein
LWRRGCGFNSRRLHFSASLVRGRACCINQSTHTIGGERCIRGVGTAPHTELTALANGFGMANRRLPRVNSIKNA